MKRCTSKTKSGSRCLKLAIKGKKGCHIHFRSQKGGNKIGFEHLPPEVSVKILKKLSDSDINNIIKTANSKLILEINNLYESKYHKEFYKRTELVDNILGSDPIKTMKDILKRVPPEARSKKSWFYYYMYVKTQLRTLTNNKLLLFKIGYSPKKLTTEEKNTTRLDLFNNKLTI